MQGDDDGKCSDEYILRECNRMLSQRNAQDARASNEGWFPVADEGSHADTVQHDERSTAMPKRPEWTSRDCNWRQANDGVYGDIIHWVGNSNAPRTTTKGRWRAQTKDAVSEMGIVDVFGPDVTLGVLGKQGQSTTVNRIAFFREKGQKLMNTVDGWEKVTLIVDSGASDTVVPPSVCSRATLHHTSKVGTEYECANQDVIENLGEKRCQISLAGSDGKRDAGTDGMSMSFQVVDVSKALLSVSKVCDQGHEVVFTKTGGYIMLNGDAKQSIPLRLSGGVYELDMWVKPQEGFARPGTSE